MTQQKFTKGRCYHYERNDWVKVDVTNLLAPWVNRVADIYQIRKTPAKHIVTYALSTVVLPLALEIRDVAFMIFEGPKTFQRKYGTRMEMLTPDTNILVNPNGFQPEEPCQVNFMDLVDYWAKPLNHTFGIGIGQCRDVIKIALAFFIANHAPALAHAIHILVHSPDSELFTGQENIIFLELNLASAIKVC